MASQPDNVARFGIAPNHIAFRLETKAGPPTAFAARFLLDLDTALRSHLLHEKIQIKDNATRIKSISIGSLKGELVALIADNVSLKVARDALAAFIPSVQDVISLIFNRDISAAEPHNRDKARFIQTVADGVAAGDVSGVLINMAGANIVNNIYIDEPTGHEISSALHHKSGGKKSVSDAIKPAAPSRLMKIVSGRCKIIDDANYGMIAIFPSDKFELYKIVMDSREDIDELKRVCKIVRMIDADIRGWSVMNNSGDIVLLVTSLVVIPEE